MNTIKVLAFTHKSLDLTQIGDLHIDDEQLANRLSGLKQRMQLDELMFLSTCNRVEFVLVCESHVDSNFIFFFLKALYPHFGVEQIQVYKEHVETFEGIEAVAHLQRVATSVDSMVVGEREIITQVRSAYEKNKNLGLTGDTIRLMMRHTIETAKKVFSTTAIAKNPVSIVSLAYHKLRETHANLDARILFVGAGTTNQTFCKLLTKHGFKNFTVFNRSIERAEKMAGEIGAQFFGLNDLETYTGGFDILITCTGSDEAIITPDIYKALLNQEQDKKTIVDLAIPYDVDAEVIAQNEVNYITVTDLKEISDLNLQRRIQEVEHVNSILDTSLTEFHNLFRQRKVELAMREVPEKVKEIRQTAQAVFARDLEKLDEDTSMLVQKMMDFMEKKYLSMPMKMAKEIMIKH